MSDNLPLLYNGTRFPPLDFYFYIYANLSRSNLYISLTICQVSEKTNEPISRRWLDGQMNR